MEDPQSKKVMAFDTLFTTNKIQMMKILMTYMAPSTQKTLAIYIKFMELQYTLTFFQIYPDNAICGLDNEKEWNISKLCDELLPFCGPGEQEKILQIRSMIENFDKMQEMMQMVQMMQEMFPDGAPFGDMNGESGGGFDFLSGLSGMDFSQFSDLFQSK